MPTAKKVVLINDTSLFNAHFGCQLVGQTFRENFARHDIDLIATLPLSFDPQNHRAVFDQADLLVINGEGSIHHGRNLRLLELAHEYPVALVNAVYQENPPVKALAKCKFIAARESRSAALIQSHGAEAHVVPDVIFDSMLLNGFTKPPPAEDIGITDSVLDKNIGFGPKPPLVSDYLTKLCQYRRIATGRYHSAIACMVLRIPFCAWPSNTWKIEGMMKDAHAPELCASDYQTARATCPTACSERTIHYASEARKRIRWMFSALAGI